MEKVTYMRVVNNITELIGDTPVVKLNRIVPNNDDDVYIKLELLNPTKRVKDRAALSMIEAGEKAGILKPGATIIEPTSGNTGIGLAMNAAAKGYSAIMVMPDNSTEERRNLLREYGAEVVLTPSSEKMPGAIQKAKEIQAEIPGSFIPQQFENEANPNIHRSTTGVEILEQMENELDAFVCTAGTGGTVTGTGESLKEALPELAITVAEPKGSPVLSGGKPGKHKLVGTSPGFIPDILNTNIFDEIMQIEDEDAVDFFKKLSAEEGIFTGLSGGADVDASIEDAKRIGPGKKVLCIAPDTGERYLSMEL